jgi:hypothetical protein
MPTSKRSESLVWTHQPERKKGDSMKSSGRSLTLAAIEKGPSRERGSTGETRRKKSLVTKLINTCSRHEVPSRFGLEFDEGGLRQG